MRDSRTEGTLVVSGRDLAQIGRVVVYDTDPAATRTFAGRVAFLGLPVEVVTREVVEHESDVICTATSALVQQTDDRSARPAGSSVFDSTGFALEDLVVAELLLRHVTEQGVGRRLTIEGVTGDPRDPFDLAGPGRPDSASGRRASAPTMAIPGLAP